MHHKRSVWHEGQAMKGSGEKQVRCRHCGNLDPFTEGVCTHCGRAREADAPDADRLAEWERAGDALKMKWVIAVIAFWISAAVLAAVLVVDDRLDLVLVSIALGLLVLGVWLKTRYQVHLRSDPSRR